jgi:hypothetical protein
MKKVAFIFILFSTFSDLNSQDFTSMEPIFPRYNIGVGGGIDYGGFGGRLTVLTSERLQFFGALGYNLLEVGMNAGVSYRILPQSGICPYFGVMYGYNAAIKIKGTDMYNQTYYGPSWNLGLEFWSKRNPNFLNLELIVPFRCSEFHQDIKKLRSNSTIVIENEPFPVGISIGYHFSF